MKISLISSFLGQTKDRFSYYNSPLSNEEKVAFIEKIPGVNGIELVHHYEFNDVAETKALLEKYNIQVAAVNANVKAEPEFVNGGLTSPDPEVRQRAVQMIKNAMDFAEELGADKVTVCPLSDGYEFSLQHDYIVVWERLKSCLKEAANYKPQLNLFVEYKPSETRGKCILNNASKTLLMIKETGCKNLGVTLDYGHSVYGGENPSEDLALIHNAQVPYYIHINDNDGKWDWDYFCASKNVTGYIEFIYYLKKYNYQDFLTSDTSPTRWDIEKTFAANARITQKISKRIDEIGLDKMEEIVNYGDYMDTWLFIEEEIMKL